MIARPLMVPPEPSKIVVKDLKRWEYIQKLLQDFWNRWTREYLLQQQQRHKWRSTRTNPNVGDLVVVKDKTLPPTRWLLGRILTLHPGADDQIRFVTIRIKGNEYIKQPMTNIIVLDQH